MRYAIAIIAFVLALPLTVFAFGNFMPRAYFEWLKSLSWGREVGGLIMFGIAFAIAAVAFCLAS